MKFLDPSHRKRKRRITARFALPLLLYSLLCATVTLVNCTNTNEELSTTSGDGVLHTRTFNEPQTNRLTGDAQCPYVCSCIWKGGKQTATCDRRSLTALPVGLDSGVQVIDLTGNALSILPPNVFLERGLVNLQRIHLADCSLIDISAEAFVKLSNLIELDLSNNSLTAVPSKSFAEAPSLRRLSLGGNRLRELRSGAFLTLVRLQSLDISHNQIVHLDTDAFRGLRSLQILNLEGNQLASIPTADTFVGFLPTKMASLALHDNRWRCDCHLAPLRAWIALNNVPLEVDPICGGPPRLQGSKWNEIASHEFACAPTIHAPTGSAHLYKHIGNNITLACPVSGHPVPKVQWIFELPGAILLHEPDSILDHDENITELDQQSLPSGRYSIVQDNDPAASHALVSVLTIHALQPEDSQRITCRAKNVGGVVQHNFTLLVSTQEPFSSSRSMDFIVTEMFVIFASIAVLLLILLVFVALFIARVKNQRRANVQDSCGQEFGAEEPPAYRHEEKLMYSVVQNHPTHPQLLISNTQNSSTTSSTHAPSSSSASSAEPASDFSASEASTSVTLLNNCGVQQSQPLLFTPLSDHQHLLNGTGQFYVAPTTTICDDFYGQYPLLTQLDSAVVAQQQAALIYGTHGITPTAMIKPKVTFADQNFSESAQRAACAYATLTRRHATPQSQMLNRSHRAVNSFPEGFTSILSQESSVDSAGESLQDSIDASCQVKPGAPISAQRVDETEEDEYYRALAQGTNV